jgi:hypothetical protein
MVSSIFAYLTYSAGENAIVDEIGNRKRASVYEYNWMICRSFGQAPRKRLGACQPKL